MTEERLEHIAAVLKNGLTDEVQNCEQYKHLLQMLSQLTDSQIIILQANLYSMALENKEFFETHRELLGVAGSARMGSDQETIDRSVVHKDYRQHLTRLNLLRPRFKKPKKGVFPEFDERTGMIKASGYELTPLGRLLLRSLDIGDKD